jgi:hypothetical protein
VKTESHDWVECRRLYYLWQGRIKSGLPPYWSKTIQLVQRLNEKHRQERQDAILQSLPVGNNDSLQPVQWV